MEIFGQSNMGTGIVNYRTYKPMEITLINNSILVDGNWVAKSFIDFRQWCIDAWGEGALEIDDFTNWPFPVGLTMNLKTPYEIWRQDPIKNRDISLFQFHVFEAYAMGVDQKLVDRLERCFPEWFKR